MGFQEFEQPFVLENIQGTLDIETLPTVTGIVTGTTGAGTAGTINLDTAHLSLQEGAVMGGLTFGAGRAGNLTINAAESIKVVGSGLFNILALGSTGNGNRIEMETSDLTISDGAVIANVNLGAGSGGDILIKAVGQIELLRTLPNSIIPSGIFSNSVIGEGEAGNISINTQKLNIQDGTQIASNSGALVRRFRLLPQNGMGGKINIMASESIEVSGVSPGDIFFPSSISSSAYSNGNAGNLNIETNTLTVGDGGLITSSTFNKGQGANLTINASESITIFGTSRDGQLLSGIISASGELNTAAERELKLDNITATGDAGSLSITTGNLSISDRGRVTVNSLGSGDAGILEIRANEIQLENQGQIGAKTVFGDGGNIVLNLDERLTLRNNSLISAEAEENANGGNITIDTEFIIAFPNQNNDIIANAERGNGGNIKIISEGIFGIEERPQNLLTNDINASSDFGLDGTISISNPDTNIGQIDTEIPNNIVEPKTLGVNACSGGRGTEASTFTVKGKGGIPPLPTELFMADVLIPDGKPITIDQETDLNSLLVGEIETEQRDANYDPNYIPPYIKPIETSMGDIYPARGIIKTEDGEIILTVYPTDNLNTRTPHNSANCRLLEDEEQETRNEE